MPMDHCLHMNHHINFSQRASSQNQYQAPERSPHFLLWHAKFAIWAPLPFYRMYFLSKLSFFQGVDLLKILHSRNYAFSFAFSPTSAKSVRIGLMICSNKTTPNSQWLKTTKAYSFLCQSGASQELARSWPHRIHCRVSRRSSHVQHCCLPCQGRKRARGDSRGQLSALTCKWHTSLVLHSFIRTSHVVPPSHREIRM